MGALTTDTPPPSAETLVERARRMQERAREDGRTEAAETLGDLIDESERIARALGATPVAKEEPPAVDRNVTKTSLWHPETSQKAGQKALPRSGSHRRRAYDHIRALGERGATDDEIEQWSNRPHQSASATMSALRSDGWLKTSRDPDTNRARTRLTRYGNSAQVWEAVLPDDWPGPLYKPEA